MATISDNKEVVKNDTTPSNTNVNNNTSTDDSNNGDIFGNPPTKRKLRLVTVKTKDSKADYRFYVDNSDFEGMSYEDMRHAILTNGYTYNANYYKSLKDGGNYAEARKYLERYTFTDYNNQKHRDEELRSLYKLERTERKKDEIATNNNEKSVIDFHKAYTSNTINQLFWYTGDDGSDCRYSDEEFAAKYPDAAEFRKHCYQLYLGPNPDMNSLRKCSIRFPYDQFGANDMDDDFAEYLTKIGTTEENLKKAGVEVVTANNKDKILKFDVTNPLFYKLTASVPIKNSYKSQAKFTGYNDKGDIITPSEGSDYAPMMEDKGQYIQLHGTHGAQGLNYFDYVFKYYNRMFDGEHALWDLQALSSAQYYVNYASERNKAIDTQISENATEIELSSRDIDYTNEHILNVKDKLKKGLITENAYQKWMDEEYNIIKTNYKQISLDQLPEVLCNVWHVNRNENEKGKDVEKSTNTVDKIVGQTQLNDMQDYLSTPFADKMTIKHNVDADGTAWTVLYIPMPDKSTVEKSELSAEDKARFKPFLNKRVIIKFRGDEGTDYIQKHLDERPEYLGAIDVASMQTYQQDRTLSDGSTVKCNKNQEGNYSYYIKRKGDENFRQVDEFELANKFAEEEAMRLAISHKFKFSDITGDGRLPEEIYQDQLNAYCATLCKEIYRTDFTTIDGQPIDPEAYAIYGEKYVPNDAIYQNTLKALQFYRKLLFKATKSASLYY